MDHLQNAATWNEATASSYDAQNADHFAPEVLGPTIAVLKQLSSGEPALEFAIGTGRVGVALLQAGVPVHGIEYSPHMLKVLREKVSDRDLPVALGDMATTQVDGRFGLVYLVYNTISNLLTEEAQQACFHNAAHHLLPGGFFLIENGCPELDRLDPQSQTVVFANTPGYLGIDLYDTEKHHLVSHHFRWDPTTENRADAILTMSRHRYLSPVDMDAMAQAAGFRPLARYETWDDAMTLREGTMDPLGRIAIYQL